MDEWFQSLHFFRVYPSTGGDDGYDDVFGESLFDDFMEGCPAVHEGHHKVHKDDAFESPFKFLDAVIPAVDGEYFEVLVFEERSQENQQVRVIVDNHDFFVHFFQLLPHYNMLYFVIIVI